jgi:hypothetical protein
VGDAFAFECVCDPFVDFHEFSLRALPEVTLNDIAAARLDCAGDCLASPSSRSKHLTPLPAWGLARLVFHDVAVTNTTPGPVVT